MDIQTIMSNYALGIWRIRMTNCLAVRPSTVHTTESAKTKLGRGGIVTAIEVLGSEKRRLGAFQETCGGM